MVLENEGKEYMVEENVKTAYEVLKKDLVYIYLNRGSKMFKTESLCGIACSKCELKDICGKCSGVPCKLKKQLISEFNALGIEDMDEITDLNSLKGSFVNLEYTLLSGQVIKFWDDDRIYLGNQICKKNSDRCYGLTADENCLLICEYGEGSSDAEIVVYKKRR